MPEYEQDRALADLNTLALRERVRRLEGAFRALLEEATDMDIQIHSDRGVGPYRPDEAIDRARAAIEEISRELGAAPKEEG